MKRIGIVAHGGLFTTELTNEDRYYFGNNYNKRIAQCGGLPLGLLPSDGELNEAAFDQCDALLISGGTKLWPYHFQAVHHAVKTGKKLLGICLGMQTTNQYFLSVEAAEENGTEQTPLALFHTPRPELGSVEGHCNQILRGREELCKHSVNLCQDSLIRQLVGADSLSAASVHKHCVAVPSKYVSVTGYAQDGTIEVIEYKDHILGTQFHPEVDDQLLCLFRWLCE